MKFSDAIATVLGLAVSFKLGKIGAFAMAFSAVHDLRGVVSGASQTSSCHVVVESVYFRLGLTLVNGFALVDGNVGGEINGVNGVDGFAHDLAGGEPLGPLKEQ